MAKYILKSLRCWHRKIFKVCLAILQHHPWKGCGHFTLSMQLQVLSLVTVLELVILWLFELIIVFIFGMQVLPHHGNYSYIKYRKCFPTFDNFCTMWWIRIPYFIHCWFLVVVIFCLVLCFVGITCPVMCSCIMLS